MEHPPTPKPSRMGIGPYLTGTRVTLLTPDGDLQLKGAIFREDLLEGAYPG